MLTLYRGTIVNALAQKPETEANGNSMFGPNFVTWLFKVTVDYMFVIFSRLSAE